MVEGSVAFGPYLLDLRRSVLTKNGRLVALRGRSATCCMIWPFVHADGRFCLSWRGCGRLSDFR
jgi:hypothetical protein